MASNDYSHTNFGTPQQISTRASKMNQLKTVRSKKKVSSTQNYDLQKYMSQIDRMVSANGKMIGKHASKVLCNNIKNAKTLEHLYSILNSVCPEKPNNAKLKARVFQALLEQERYPWEVKKYLFSVIPSKSKNIYIYHSYIFAAEQTNEYQTIQKAFEDIKRLKIVNVKSYSIFIKVIAHQGYIERAKKIFLEAKASNMLDATVYNSQINLLGKHASFAEIQELFDEAISKGHASTTLVNSYIHICGKHGMYHLAKAAFQLLQMKKEADKFSYTSIMNAAQNEFDDLKAAFEEALATGLYDDRTLNSYIDLAGKNRCFDEALRIFNTTKQLNLATHVTYINFIFAATFNGHLKEAFEAYEEARQLFPDNLMLIECAIKTMGENNQYQKALKIFKTSLELKIAKSSTFEMFIYIAGLNKKLANLNEYFELAVNLKLAGPATYTRYIDALANCEQFKKCKETFEKMKDLMLIDSIAVSRFIRAAGKIGTPYAVSEAYTYAKKRKLLDVCSICDTIEALGAHKQFTQAKNILNQAIELGLTDIYIYNTFLKCAAINDEFEEALSLFTEMVKNNTATVVSYNTMIDIATQSKNLELAKSLFFTSKEKKFANCSTYTSYMKILGQFHQYVLLKQIFNEALAKNLNDISLYNCYMYYMGANQDFETVQNVFDKVTLCKKANGITYSIYIDIMGAQGNIDTVMQAFNEAEKLGLIDIILFTSYMEALKKSGKSQEVDILFETVRKLNIADARFYTSYISFNPSRARELLEGAMHKNIADDGLFSCVMKIEGEKGDYAALKAIFLNASNYKAAGKITYLMAIDYAGKLNQFEDATLFFNEAVEFGFKNLSIHNSYLNAASIAKEFGIVCKLFHKMKAEGIADKITYTIVINAASNAGHFQVAKDAFYEFKKLKINDDVIYMNYLVAAEKADDITEINNTFNAARTLKIVTSRIYSIYLSFLGKIADRIRLSHISNNHKISFDQIKNLFYEADSLNLLNVEIFIYYIQNAYRYGELEEAAHVLNKMKERGFTNGIENIYVNWKVKLALLPKRETIQNLEHELIIPLQSPSYRLFHRYKHNKNTLNNTQEIISSPKLKQKLDEKIQLIAKTNNRSASLSLKSLLFAFAYEAKLKKTPVAYARLTGGAVPYCFDEDFYQNCFEQAAGRPDQPFLNATYKSLFNALFKERFLKPLNDWDFKLLIDSKEPQKIANISDSTLYQISSTPYIEPDAVKKLFMHKQFFIDDEENLYSLRRVVDHQGTGYEIAVGGLYARSNLFQADALQISLDSILFNRSDLLIATEGSIEEAAIDYFLKRLQASNSNTINKHGCSTYIARRAQGYYGSDKKLELHVCETFTKLTAEESISLLIHAKETHCRKLPEMGLAILFHTCSILSEYGYFKEAEELRAASEQLWYSSSKNIFYNTLINLWIKEKRPFMQVKAGLEMIGLLYLISNKSSEIICRLDEHQDQQVIELIINDSYLSVPLNPENTFIVFFQDLNLDHFVKALSPKEGFHFNSNSSEIIATNLGISPPQLNDLKKKWMSLEIPVDEVVKKKRKKRKKPKAVKNLPEPTMMDQLWNWASSWMSS